MQLASTQPQRVAASSPSPAEPLSQSYPLYIKYCKEIMNHPTTHPNSSSSVPLYPQPNVQQNQMYHQYPPPPPPPPLPMTPGYYYSPHHQHGQQSSISYPQQQQSSYQTQHHTSTTTQNNKWPGPPTADNTQHSIEQMDTTTSRSPSPASYAIERAASALSAFSQPQQSSNDSKSDDPLLSLARAASFQDSLTTGSPPMSLSTSPSPSSSSTLLHTPSAGPLKKRRKVLGIEKEDDQTKKSSADESIEDRKLNDNKNLSGGESNSPSLVPSLAWSSKSSSVEDMMKDTSNSNSNDVSRQFPNVLHKLLSKSVDSNNSKQVGDDNTSTSKISLAMEWLNHGKAFRILRYDILCTEVLPKEMPMLCSDRKKKEKMMKMNDDICKSESRDDEQTKVEEGSNKYSDDEWVDAFSWFVKSYGFEEVMSGRDKGSFRHEVSILLCTYDMHIYLVSYTHNYLLYFSSS